MVAQQLLIGVALGFALQMVFDALGLAGQLLANSMGLSFAFNVDPLRGSSTAALGQLYIILATLTFPRARRPPRAARGAGRTASPRCPSAPRASAAKASGSLVLWGGQLFAGAIAIALPGVTALLIVNLAFGVVSRAAPSLNLFAVGFPISLVVGLLVVLAGIGPLQEGVAQLIAQGFALPARPERGAEPWPRAAANAPNKLHRSASRRRARKARFRVRTELSTAAVCIAAAVAIYSLGRMAAGQFADFMRDSLSLAPATVMSEDAIWPALTTAGARALWIVLPILGATFVAALAAPIAIGGWNFSGSALMPQFSRLNPASGLGRMFSTRGMVELGKGLAKVGRGRPHRLGAAQGADAAAHGPVVRAGGRTPSATPPRWPGIRCWCWSAAWR